MKMTYNKTIKQFLKNWLPPALLHIMRGRNKITWVGNYGSWAEAQKASTGYDSEIILNKVKDSLLKVKKGDAVYERDSVLFDKIQYSWPILAGLMWIAAQSKGELNVIDYGGSLGSTYFQNREFLQTLPEVRWNIVEQNHFVDVGKKYFEDDIIKFFYDIESCVKQCSPNTIVFSSVIQYLEKPYSLLERVKAMNFEFVIFDRTSFVCDGRDRLTVQKVPSDIYSASYPCWFLDRKKVYAFFEEDYELIADFDALTGIMKIDNSQSGLDKGIIFRQRRKNRDQRYYK
jgi:putative methyltransferase (TIGR04325 family)